MPGAGVKRAKITQSLRFWPDYSISDKGESLLNLIIHQLCSFPQLLSAQLTT